MKNLLANFMYLFGTLVQFFVYGSILGCALAYVILYAITEGYLIRWEPVPSPPGKAVKILASDCYRAFVQTASGEKYECKASSWQCLALLDVPEEIQTRSMADFPHSYRPPLKLDGAIQMTEYFEDHFEYNC